MREQQRKWDGKLCQAYRAYPAGEGRTALLTFAYRFEPFPHSAAS